MPCKTFSSLTRRTRSGCYTHFASLIVLSSDVQTTKLSFKRLPTLVPAFMSGIILLLIIPTVVLPLYANILLTKGYILHLTDVNKANAYFEKGLSLGTYADLEYGYQAYHMATDHQVVQLSGKTVSPATTTRSPYLRQNFKNIPMTHARRPISGM